jgi:hypothetical protein
MIKEEANGCDFATYSSHIFLYLLLAIMFEEKGIHGQSLRNLLDGVGKSMEREK